MFEKINLTIYSPDRSKMYTAEVNTILTVSQVVGELVKNNFVPEFYDYGVLLEEDGRVLSSHAMLNNISDNSIIRVVAFSENQMVNGDTINVTILHPTNGQSMEVELNNRLSVEEIINELINSNFIVDSVDKSQYKIFIKNSQTEISGKETLISGGTIDGSVLKIVI